MQKSPILPILVLLGILIGAGVYLLGSDSEQQEPGLALQDVAPKQQEEARSSGPMAGAKNMLTGADTAGEAKRAAVSLTEEPAKLRASVGQAGITGRVVDTAGKGLGGARVIIGGSDPFPLLSIMTANSTFAKRWSAVTRTDGTFELVGPEPGELRVGANLAGFVPAEVTNLVLPADSGLDVGDVIMEFSVMLEGRVMVDGGRGVAGAELRIQDPNADFNFFGGANREAATSTDENGYFRLDTLAAGPWKVLVTTEEHPDRTFEGRTERPGELQANLEFNLAQGFTIAGMVRGARPEDLVGIEVSARPGSGGMRFANPGGAEQRTATVANDGSFLVRGCREGEEYTLTGRLATGESNPFMPSPAVTERIKGTAGDTGVDLPWIGSTGAEFQVVSAATGQPIEDFNVNSGSGWLQPFQVDGETVVYHPEGKVSLTGLRVNGGGFRMGPFKVVIEAAGFETFERELNVVEGEVLAAGVFSLKSAAVVAVTVLDAGTGRPVEGAAVRLSVGDSGGGFAVAGWGNRDGDSNGATRSAKTGSDGVARLSSFEGQTGRLTVEHDAHTTWRNDNFAMPTAAPVEIEARLGMGGTVLVTVIDALGNPKPGARVETRKQVVDDGSNNGGRFARGARMAAAFGGGGGDGTAVADSNGVATFYHLEPGNHEFKVAENSTSSGFAASFSGGDESGNWLAVEVTEQGRHELTLREEATGVLSGTISENGIGLAGAELNLNSGEGGMGRGMGRFSFGQQAGPGTGTTDGRGEYSLSGVEPGSYDLEISHAGRVMKSVFPVEIVAGQNNLDAALSIAVVEGNITDDQGKPLEGVKVEIKRAAQGAQPGFMIFMESGGDTAVQVGGGGADPSITDANGFYSLRGVETGVDLQVSATTELSSPAKTDVFTVGEGETRQDTDLVLNPAGTIAFEITGGEDSYYLLVATPLDEEGMAPKTEFSETRKGTIKGLKPGKWSVTARPVGPNSSDQSSEEVVVVIEPAQESKVVIEI
ncbi:MAG: protocatechuate 3,4-dioxygenase beta subunit [Gammaproteobacteria bacterium]|jgi:protocatechuate 3,4-dioxygenase beta subunit